MLEYSFLLPLYHRDDLNALREAIESIVNQTFSPKEILIIIDNISNPEHLKLINQFKDKKIKVLTYQGNGGLGGVLAKGVLSSSTEIILRQDSDDISIKDRAIKQIDYLKKTGADIVGSNIKEFISTPEDLIKSVRKINLEKNNYFFRNPLNHMSVAFRRSSIIKCGNYKSLKNFEDWYLWLRAIKSKCKIEVMNETLIHARLGKKYYNKRHGFKYYLTELKAMNTFLKEDLIPVQYFLINVFLRFFIRILPLIFTNYFYKQLRGK